MGSVSIKVCSRCGVPFFEGKDWFVNKYGDECHYCGDAGIGGPLDVEPENIPVFPLEKIKRIPLVAGGPCPKCGKPLYTSISHRSQVFCEDCDMFYDAGATKPALNELELLRPEDPAKSEETDLGDMVERFKELL